MHLTKNYEKKNTDNRNKPRSKYWGHQTQTLNTCDSTMKHMAIPSIK